MWMASAGSPIHSIQKKKTPHCGPESSKCAPISARHDKRQLRVWEFRLGSEQRKEDDGPGETPTPRCVVACVAHAIIEDLELESPPSTKQKRFSIFFVIEFRRIRITNRLGK